MPKQQVTFKQWYARLGESVPLDTAPRILGRSVEEIEHAVRTGALPVHRFEAADGRIFRLVRVRDLFALGQNPLTIRGLARALQIMVGRDEVGQPPNDRRAA
ncbi:MAG: hypothetical protein JJU36_08855 [Phycisphaeraceae bacterium]|nr:hypothetical protein [Phycisphaeraceae bacterium]